MNNKRRRFSTFFGVAVVLVMALAACGSAVQTHPADLASADPAASNPGVDNHLPADFQITAYEGEDVLGSQEVQFTDLLGQGKPIVPNLWAGLCPPCRLEMPDFEAVSEALGDQVLFFGLDVGPFTSLGTSKDGRQLVKHLGITYPTGTTTDAELV